MRPGDTVAARFQIEAQVGEGGMGKVFRAHDLVQGVPVAIKTLSLHGESARRRFEREASVLARVEHPNVVGYVAHGMSAPGSNDISWLAMEWVEGVEPDEEGVELTLRDAYDVIRGAARGLSAAHAAGVVHRDIKPSNLMLVGGDPERVKVLDFGIARGAAGEDVAVTATGEAIGTPYYMAPEQARGTRDLDARVDVYALGAVFYHLVSRQPVFDGPSHVAILAKILLETPTPLGSLVSGIPPELLRCVGEMLSRDRDLRPRDASELLQRLDQIEVPRDARGAALRAPKLSLGSEERGLVCAVLVGGLDHVGMHAPTMVSEPVAALDPGASLAELAQQFDGGAERLADGTLVVTFAGGSPTDEARRAARCALALREVAASRPIALVGGYAPMSTVIPVGEVLDRGAQLLDAERDHASDVAGIVIDDTVRALLGPRFATRPQGPSSFELIEAAPSDADERFRGVAIPCVGRRRDVGVLRGLFEECDEESMARPAIVVGAPGVGKSRLFRVFTEGVAEEATVLEARGDGTRAGAPYVAIENLLRRAASIRDVDPPGVRQVKLASRLSRSLTGDALNRALHFLCELVQAPFPPGTSDALDAARLDPSLMSDGLRVSIVTWWRGPRLSRSGRRGGGRRAFR